MTAKKTEHKNIIKNCITEYKNIIKYCAYAALFMGIGAYLHALITPNAATMQKNEPPYVLTRPLTKGDVSEKKKYIAKVEAINSVDIIPQVSGYLEKILFESGAEVTEGESIFVIEQTQYKADSEKAEAAVEKAQKQYDRLVTLNKNKYTSDRDVEVVESELKQAKAKLEIAKLNLEHSEIKSPINGKIGKALVTVGYLVTPSSSKLARIVQTNPIRIAFSVSDKERLMFMKNPNVGEEAFVEIVLPNGDIKQTETQNVFVDNEVDATTATIPVYLDFENSDYLLVPGNYVDIYVHFTSAKNALMVPQQALMSDINGTYVMTVNQDNKVEQKYIVLGPIMGENQVVKSGLNGDERVIVQGLQKVAPGILVNPNHLTNEK